MQHSNSSARNVEMGQLRPIPPIHPMSAYLPTATAIATGRALGAINDRSIPQHNADPMRLGPFTSTKSSESPLV